MRGIKNKVLTLATVALTLTGIFPFGLIPEVSAETVDAPPEKLTVTDAVFANGDFLLDENNPVKAEASIIVDLSWQLAENTHVAPKEDVVLSLPEKLAFEDVVETEFADGTYRVENNALIFNFNDNAYEIGDTTLPAYAYSQYSGTLSLDAAAGKVTADTASEDVDFGNGVIRTIHYDHGDDDGDDDNGKNSGEFSNGAGGIQGARGGVRSLMGDGIGTHANGGRDITTLVDESRIDPNTKEVLDMKKTPDGYTIFDSFYMEQSDDGTTGWKIVDSSNAIVSGDHVRLNYKWSIDEVFRDRELLAGDTFSFKLPDFIEITDEMTGDLTNDKGMKFADYVINTDGSVKFTFTKNIESNSGVKGTFWVKGKATSENNGDPTETKVPFVITDGKEVPVIYIKNRDILSKGLRDDKSPITGDGSKHIVEWELKVNKTGEYMNQGWYLIDTLPEGMTFKEVTSITEHDVDLSTGDIKKPGTDVTTSGVITKDNQYSGLKFDINEKTNKYYSIWIKTEVTNLHAYLNSENEYSHTFTNNAALFDEKDVEKDKTTASWSAQYDFEVKKTGERNDLADGTAIYKWTVNVTHKGLPIPAGTVFGDHAATAISMVDKDGNAITFPYSVENSGGYTLTMRQSANNSKNYSITAKEKIDKDFTMTYYTKEQIHGNTWISNTIEILGERSESQYWPKPWRQDGIVKGYAKGSTEPKADGTDTQEILHWETIFNPQHKHVDSWYVTDTMSGGIYMKPEDKSSVVVSYKKSGSSEWIKLTAGTDYVLTWGDEKAVPADTDKNFLDFTIVGDKFYDTIKDNGKSINTAAFKIEYTTHFSNARDGETRKNNAYVHYTSNGWKYDDNSWKDFVIEKPPLDKSLVGSKYGDYTFKYDNETDKNIIGYLVDWTIDINTDNGYKYGENDSLSDLLPSKWNIVADTDNPTNFKIQAFEVDGQGNEIDITNQLNQAGKLKVVVSGTTRKTIKVTDFEKDSKKHYRFKIATEYSDPVNFPIGEIKNTATFKGTNVKDTILPATVQGNVKDKLLTKTGEVNSKDGYQIDYEVLIKPQGEKLGNVVVTDSFGSHLILKEDPDDPDFEPVKVWVATLDKNGKVKSKVEYPSSNYVIEAGTKGFKIKFGTEFDNDGIATKAGRVDLTENILISYSGKAQIPDGYEGSDLSVENKVTITGDRINFIPEPSKKTVKVSDSGGSAEAIVGKYKLLKKDKANGKPIVGAEFTLYKGNDATGKFVAVNTTNSAGTIEFTGLTAGNYFLKETKPADGYFLDPNDAGIKFTLVMVYDDINDEYKILPLPTATIENEQSANIRLVKTADNAGKGLPGALFELYHFKSKSDTAPTKVIKDAKGATLPGLLNVGEFTDVFRTDAEGKIEVKNLVPGLYKFKEVQAPTNYKISLNNGFTDFATLVSDNEAFIEVDAENERITGEIGILKHSNDNPAKALSGAEFTLTGTDGTDTSQTTGAGGKVLFTGLKAGEVYKIEETGTPFGHEGKVEITNIKVAQDGKVTYSYNGKDDIPYINGVEIEVQNDLIKTKLKGKKIWKHDNLDADFILPKQIQVTLMQKSGINQAPYGSPRIVTADENWEYSFDDLPKYDLDGKTEYVYTVVEAGVGGFTSVVSDPQVGTNEIITDITNTATTTKVEGVKSWDPAATGYNAIPDGDVEFTLFYKEKGAADSTWTKFERGGKVETTTTNASSSWKYNFTNLPTHKNGKEIEYSVEETKVTGFTPIYTGYDTYNEMETTKVTVVKNWQDNNNHYKSRPTTVNFTLLVKVGNDWQTFEDVYGTAKTLQLTGIHDVPMWTGEFSKLPVYDKQGDKIAYGVREEQDGKIGKTYKVSDGQYEKAVDENGTVAFNNTEQLMEIEVAKDWEDFENNFGSRPTKIDFQVKAYPAGGNPNTAQIVTTKTNPTGVYTINIVTGTPDDKLKVTGLPMYNAAGTELAYVIEEINMATNYEKTPEYLQDENNKDDFTIVNKLIVVPNQVNKIWEEKGITDYARPEVKFTLMHHIEGQTEADAVAVGTEAEGYVLNLKGNDLMIANWTGHFANAPKFTKDGKLYIYTVKEEMISATKGNYTTVQAGTTFTNTVETTNVAGVKTWDDGGDQDGLRPTQIEVQLVKNKVAVPGATQVVKPDAAGNWNYNFTNLAKFDENGEEYIYTIKELNVPTGYTNDEAGMNVKNTHIPETVNPEGQKFWDDQDDHFENRPEEIKLYLIKADARPKGMDYPSEAKWLAAIEALKVVGTEITVKADEMTYVDANGDEQTVTMEAGAWKYNWNHLNLPKYEKGGQEINYLVIEEAISMYGTQYMDEDSDGDIIDDFNFDITNRQAQLADTFKFDAEKIWEDGENQYDTRPEKVTFELYYKGDDREPIDTKDVTANAEGVWKYTFELALVDYPKGTTGDDFYIKEINLPANYTKQDGQNLKVKNTLKTIDVTGTKTWEDANNQDGKRPDSIEVQLMQNDQPIKFDPYATPITVTPNKEGEWTYEFTALPKVDAEGNEYKYSVEEVNTPAGYEAKAEGMNITNTHIPEKTQHSVKKVWVDADDNDGKRPDSIEVQLYANGEKYGKPVQLKNNSDELQAWQHTWTDLDKYADGKLIKYEVKENLGNEWKDFYTPKYDGDRDITIITNVHTSITIDPKVTKLWKDDNQNISLTRPENIKVRLYANGELVKTVKFSGEGDTWTYQFKDLPKYKNGKEIKYEVEEEAVTNYVTTIDGFTITNTYTPPTRPGLPTTGGGSSTSTTTTSSRTTLPRTGSEQLLWVPVIGMLAMLTAILGYGYKRKKSR